MSFDVVSICKKAKSASLVLSGIETSCKNAMLDCIADALCLDNNIASMLDENKIDIENAKKSGRDKTFIDRLTLNPARIQTMVDGVRQIVALPDPVGVLVDKWTLDNGLQMNKVRSPLGVIGIIYEARPNVTVDATALCLKSGNAVVLRGSKDAINSNRALYKIMQNALFANGYDGNMIAFVDDENRETTKAMLALDNLIDVVIPRGGEGLKYFVLENAKMPVIASAGGNCHTYVEKTADQDRAVDIVINAKVQRPSTCNALEHLLVDREIAEEFLPQVYSALRSQNVEVIGDKTSSDILGIALATDEDYKTEFLTYKISIQVVDGVEMAVAIINENGTKHSEAILSQDETKMDYFAKYVDAAAVYKNASTRFTDGFEFGLGAEMGISTQKLHARGPIALNELTSIKYVIEGSGQIRK